MMGTLMIQPGCWSQAAPLCVGQLLTIPDALHQVIDKLTVQHGTTASSIAPLPITQADDQVECKMKDQLTGADA
jgi:hypothetical protein